MAKITFVFEDTDENTVLIGGEFPKDTDPNALTHAEDLAYMVGQLTRIHNKQPKTFEFIRAIVHEAANHEGEMVTGMVSSDEFHSAMASRKPRRLLRSRTDRSRDD